MDQRLQALHTQCLKFLSRRDEWTLRDHGARAYRDLNIVDPQALAFRHLPEVLARCDSEEGHTLLHNLSAHGNLQTDIETLAPLMLQAMFVAHLATPLNTNGK